MAFTIKQNDLLPYLTGQFRQSDNVTPLDLTAATSVTFIMRLATAAVTDPPKVRRACIITDAVAGEWEYRWVLGDTDVSGEFEAEFEIKWGTRPQTVPADSYYQIIVVDDLDAIQPA